MVDIQRTVYHEEVTRQLHVMAQARESSLAIDRHSNHCATPPTNRLGGLSMDIDSDNCLSKKQ